MVKILIVVTGLVFVLLYLLPARSTTFLRIFALSVFVGLFFWSLSYVLFFDKSAAGLQFLEMEHIFSYFSLTLVFGVDGLSLFLIILTTFVFVLTMLSCWNINEIKFFIFLLLLTEVFLIFCFTVLDVLLFYISFEAILLPMFLIIGLWGGRTRKTKAAYFLLLFTVFSSLFMLFGIFLIYIETGTTNWLIIQHHHFSIQAQLVVWFCFFITFAVKIPMFPFYIWLPEAHVEAPTAGSVLLAALLLKLGGYGMLRFLIPLFPYANLYYKPFFYLICCLSIFFASFSALRQIDLKRIIAYSSIAHMNFALLGVASLTYYGIQGAIFLMLGHGLVAAALFLLVGVLYDRYHVRAVKYYGGLASVMPLFSFFFFFFSLANFSLPGTANFIGEVLILVGLMKINFFLCLFAATSIFFSAAFSVWTCNRVIFGPLGAGLLLVYTDLIRREVFYFFILFVGTLFLGLFPGALLEHLVFFCKLVVL